MKTHSDEWRVSISTSVEDSYLLNDVQFLHAERSDLDWIVLEFRISRITLYCSMRGIVYSKHDRNQMKRNLKGQHLLNSLKAAPSECLWRTRRLLSEYLCNGLAFWSCLECKKLVCDKTENWLLCLRDRLKLVLACICATELKAD